MLADANASVAKDIADDDEDANALSGDVDVPVVVEAAGVGVGERRSRWLNRTCVK